LSGALSGKVALVTGSHRGIGAACALALTVDGAALILADKLDCRDTIAAVAAKNGTATILNVDVSDEASVLALYAAAKQIHAHLDILVHCAGIIQEKPLLETSAADFDQIVGVNLKGTFLIGREALRWMQAGASERERPARVILIASDLAYYGREHFSPYVASKHGVLGLTRSWAREFAPGILVNAICPGPIDTAMLDSEHMSREWRDRELQIPLHRFGTAEEIGALATFLCGPNARYFTGQGIGPNGGSIMP
jgi:3-oxoacyl-[acyl-carrier protein] reductase